MNDKSIGVFDSGLGGLTAVKKIMELLPYENIVYFGDTYNVPYGNKSREQILNFAQNNIDFLESQNVKLILAACGTVSSYINFVNSSVKLFEVITPACITATKITKNQKIGIICTVTAMKSNSYKNCIKNINKNVFCAQESCPLLVPLIENGYINYDVNMLKTALDFYISPLIEQNIDTLILGCTHYPVVQDIIKKMFSNIKLINTSEELVKSLKFFLEKNNLCNNINKKNNKFGTLKFYVSGDTEKFKQNSQVFLNFNIQVSNKKINTF